MFEKEKKRLAFGRRKDERDKAGMKRPPAGADEKPRKTEEKQPSVIVKDRWEKTEEKEAAGVLVEVVNGKGCLREVYGETDNKTYLTLLFYDRTLLALQGDEYFCPTCEKMLKSGYELEQTQEFWQNKLNDDVPLTEAVEGIKPILGLLKSGYYVIADTELYPTDGQGNLFCEVPNAEEYAEGTCIYYYGDGKWGGNTPYFMAATEPKMKLQQGRIEEYKENPRGRALAYYMDGYMTALLDGHHKAMAAAYLHKKVPALVILPAYQVLERDENGDIVEMIAAGEFRWNCALHSLHYSLKRPRENVGAEAMKQILDMIPKYGTIEVCEEGKRLAGYYPTVETIAAYDLVGEITDKRLQDMMSGKEALEEKAIYYVRALILQKHASLFEAVSFFLEQDAFRRERYAIIKELTNLPKSDALVDFLIQVMVEYEDAYPEMKDLILDYV